MAKIFPFVKKKNDGRFVFHVRNKLISRIEVDNLIDVGCYNGEALRVYADLMNPKSCFGFEPCYDSYKKALKNTSSIKPCGAKIFNMAVGDQNCPAFLNQYSHPKRHSILERVGEKSEIQAPVMMTRLDDWAKKEGVEFLDFVKIDTQGFDLNVIQGMGNLIYTVKILIMEMMFDSLEYKNVPTFFDSFSYLDKLGLFFYCFRDIHYDYSGRTRFADVIFLNKESMEIINAY